ncbi:hypothetical protein JL722_4342 [Aureococcus anophagefferens]|nr:hypothetical protein JL722_4342 [Aureococcus anophagefferens]
MTGIVPRPFVGEVYAADEKMLTEEEAWEALQAADFKAHCDNVTYAFCGRSTCRLNGEKAVATCGCKLIKASAGSIGFNSKNAYLIRSKIVRKALYEATVLNSSTSFVNTVCGAIESRRLWRDAGFGSDFGSFSDPGYPGYWAMIDLDCDSSGSIDYNFADCDGAPCDIEQGFNLLQHGALRRKLRLHVRLPYVAANRSYVIHEYITDATATSCPELMTGLGDCAIQKTLSRNAMMTTRADTLEVYADLKSASFLSAGTECPTVSFNNVDAESEEEEVPSSSDEESVAESSDADSVKERKAAAARPKAAKPADGTAFALWISTGQTSLGDDEKVLGVFYSWAQVVKRAKDVLADGHGHENWWCPKSKGGYLPDDGDEDDDYGDREYFEDHTGSTAEPEGFISWRLASAKHGEGDYGNMAMWAQRVQLPP